jgi:hypothetical protein
VRITLSDYFLAARTGAWLLWLPIALRVHRLPRLLQSLGRRAATSASPRLPDAARAARIVTRVARLRLFDLPFFPRICLRRSLALYHVLGRMGHPVSIHIGVRPGEGDLKGHSWVTIDGKAVGERDPIEQFRTIYSYPIESSAT